MTRYSLDNQNGFPLRALNEHILIVRVPRASKTVWPPPPILPPMTP
jgi:hypothetical protein